MKTIKVNELKILFNKIIYMLENFEKVKKVEIDIDTYRYIPTNKWQSYGDNSEPFIGSLYDDIEELQKALKESKNGAYISYVDIDRVASILHYISEKMNPVDEVPFQDSKEE